MDMIILTIQLSAGFGLAAFIVVVSSAMFLERNLNSYTNETSKTQD